MSVVNKEIYGNSRTVALIGQALFGFTGLTRIYLSSYFVGFIQFALFITVLIILSQNTVSPSTYVVGTVLLLLITTIWIIDSIALGSNAIRSNPEPLWNWKYYWYDNKYDMLLGQVLGVALIVSIPIFLGIWLFNPDI